MKSTVVNQSSTADDLVALRRKRDAMKAVCAKLEHGKIDLASKSNSAGAMAVVKDANQRNSDRSSGPMPGSKSISSWSSDDVCEWLRGFEFGESYVATFQDMGIEGEDVAGATTNDCKP